METNFFINSYGVKIRKCCASCRFKQLDNKARVCVNGEGIVPPDYLCRSWKMNISLDNAGKGDGKIKKRSYLVYALDRLDSDNRTAIAAAERHLAHKRITLDDIRKEYVRNFNSVYEKI